jgi:nucleoid-associated protein YgaU
MAAGLVWKLALGAVTVVGLGAVAWMTARAWNSRTADENSVRQSPSTTDSTRRSRTSLRQPRRFDPDDETEVVFQLGGIRLPPPSASEPASAAGGSVEPSGLSRSRSAHSIATDDERRLFSGAKSYVVADGDTLSTIAKRLLGSAARWKEIAELNGIEDPTRLRVGRRLRLP